LHTFGGYWVPKGKSEEISPWFCYCITFPSEGKESLAKGNRNSEAPIAVQSAHGFAQQHHSILLRPIFSVIKFH